MQRSGIIAIYHPCCAGKLESVIEPSGVMDFRIVLQCFYQSEQIRKRVGKSHGHLKFVVVFVSLSFS